VNLAFETLVFVTMQDATRTTLTALEEAVAQLTHVTLAQRLFGDPDYLLRVVAADLADFQQIYDDQLSALPGVQRLNTTLVMKKIIDDRALPPLSGPIPTEDRGIPARPLRSRRSSRGLSTRPGTRPR
jgi:DNA-binding Lrp family transcriptional regulator